MVLSGLFAGLPFASTIRTNLSKLSNPLDGTWKFDPGAWSHAAPIITPI